MVYITFCVSGLRHKMPLPPGNYKDESRYNGKNDDWGT